MTIVIILPWPHRDLSPNSRCHWSRKARAAKAARHEAGWAALESGARALQADRLDVTLTFTPPSRRRMDTDNMLSSMKPGLDGIAEVVGVDDSKWSISLRREEPRAPGFVKIEIQEAA